MSIALSDEDSAKLIGFEAGGRRTTSTLVDGEYPPVRRLFPPETTAITAVVATGALIDASSACPWSPSATPPLCACRSRRGQVALEAGAGDDAQASEVLEAQLEGEDLVVGYNSGFLLDGLGALGTDFARLTFTDSIKPSVMSGQESLEGAPDTSYRYLIMPMRI